MAGQAYLVVLVGIPGAGKSTFAARLLARCPGMRNISPDAIRETLYPGYELGQVEHRVINHRRVFTQAYHRTAHALKDGHSVCFDATSLTRMRRRRLLRIARDAGAIAVAHYFSIDITLALQRNAQRLRQVLPGAIVNMSRLLQPPTTDEGFTRMVVHEQR